MGIIFGIYFGSLLLIVGLLLAGVFVGWLILKLIKGITGNVKDTAKILKEPKKKVSEVHTFVYEDGVKKEIVEVMK